jgi:hypothetical protein
MGTKRLIGAVLALVAVAGIAWAKGDWDAAKNKVEGMKRKQMELRELQPKEIERVVTAICEADEDERQQAGRDAAVRVADKVGRELDQLARMRDDAYRAIDEVTSDDELKSNHESARSLRDDVRSRWESIERMSRNNMRGGNLPVVSWMCQKGINEHQNYQGSNCHVSEFNTGSRRADCLRADGETCYVIELKPHNSRAISSGRRQADDSVNDLTRELAKGDQSDLMKRLISQRSDFAKCKRFERKLRCYTLCPRIDDEGNFRETSASWSDC